MKVLFTIIIAVALMVSIIIVIKKRKRLGITGVKSMLTSITFFMIAIINGLAYWFDFLGIASWLITIVLLMLGAYFTKFLSVASK
ncbi:hypothetical protein [Thalassobacillus devorans]|uniref:hypothetical protein n=1 Tax=Thalassobacillus devorans TaxID=279813 RepID=UPI000A1C8E28|nr:hypothetical protein [Thalassobacillus devorans]